MNSHRALARSVLVLTIAVQCIMSGPLAAEVRTPASLSDADVQTAIDGARDGDSVQLPAGTCSWTKGVTLKDKGIEIRGAGVGKTVIIDDTPAPPPYFPSPADPFMVKGKEGHPFRITGLTLRGENLRTAGSPATVSIDGDCKNWRIDHCEFVDLVGGISVHGWSYGLIDHCSFRTTRKVIHAGALWGIMVGADRENSWGRPLSLGSGDAVYVEDCLFEQAFFGNNDLVAVHAYDGGRFVFRHNRCNLTIEAWGSSTDTYRGVVSYEIYDNEFAGPRAAFCAMALRGGTGVIFNNQIHGGTFQASGLYLGDYRTAGHRVVLVGKDLFTSRCNGLSPIDGNLPAETAATGTHTGDDGSAVLVSAGKHWQPNQWVGYAVRNAGDPGAAGLIVSNTVDTLVTSNVLTLTKEGYKPFQNHDCGKPVRVEGAAGAGNLSSFFVRHRIKGKRDDLILCFLDAADKLPGSGALSVVGGSGAGSYTGIANLGGGGRNVWNRGDAFVITNGYPVLDQIGRAPGTDVVGGVTVQKSEPLYAWDNTLDGAPLPATAEAMGIRTFPRISDHIREGRDFFNKNKTELGYKPYVYPHPLAAGDAQARP
jgi:hypothetical protein